MVFKRGKRAQTTLFIILAILIVVVIGVYFLLQERTGGEEVMPTDFQPVYNTLLSCIEQETKTGIDILESQGGYIYLPEFEQGSEYMPFSSQLNFLGNPIPYWYYVSGNNIQKTQIPSVDDMEEDLGRYIEENIKDCDFDSYYEQGYGIDTGKPKAEVSVKDEDVKVDLNMDLGIFGKGDAVFADEHNVEVRSSLGKLYSSAREVYQKEQKTMFLENYAVDTLRLYAPVDGVEMTCSPKTWNAEDVFDDLSKAIETNTLALRNKNKNYDLNNERNKYFLVDLGVDENVRFINSHNWPSSYEVNPTESGPLMIANPVGNQPGLGVLGFCYVNYHFVYDINYPVMIQVFEKDSNGEGEIFQFPFAVVIKGNKPREPIEGSSSVKGVDTEICENKNTLMEVRTVDTVMDPVESNISFDCFGTTCDIGETSNGVLKDYFPQCYNGIISANAEGYKDASVVQSTINSGSVDIILDKLYELDVELRLDGDYYNQDAVISFIKEDEGSKTVLYPDKKSVKLSEGQYEIRVYIYDNSSIDLEGKDYEQCVDVPVSGLGSIFGATEEECFEVEIPQKSIQNSLSAGGSENYYILESELDGSRIISIDAPSLDKPESLQDLQENYIKFEVSDLNIFFK